MLPIAPQRRPSKSPTCDCFPRGRWPSRSRAVAISRTDRPSARSTRARSPADRRRDGTTFKRRWNTADATGRNVDFHALRTTYITRLGLTGAHPRTAQALARHSTMALTMRDYPDVRLLDQRAAVYRLPLPAVGAMTSAPPSPGLANA